MCVVHVQQRNGVESSCHFCSLAHPMWSGNEHDDGDVSDEGPRASKQCQAVVGNRSGSVVPDVQQTV
eukprot:1037588-Amphidinium_carterae.1